MIGHLLDTVAPVFLIVLCGYIAGRRGFFDARTIDALMRYAVRFAIPCLLFRAVSTLDLDTAFDTRIMISFYGPAFACFAIAALLARHVFGRRPGEAVAIGFAGLFSNLVLLGLPVVELAVGEAALPIAYALVSVHAPFCYVVGIIAMESLRADGRSLRDTSTVVVNTLLRNALMIGIALGFAANVAGVTAPVALASALDLVAGSALPVALVGLGGVLARYALSERIGETVTVTAISLLLHPSLVFTACVLLDVSRLDRATLVVMAAMSPGVNVFLFASMYGRGEGTAAAAVLLGTVLAVFSVSAWIGWLAPV